MKKGISPVVAVVLLIAIAVIAAVGVWYWVGAYTGKPAIGGADQYAMSITECSASGAEVLVRNIGGLMMSSNATIYDSTGTQVGWIVLEGAENLSSGAVGYRDIEGNESVITAGQYKIIDSSYPEYSFTCS